MEAYWLYASWRDGPFEFGLPQCLAPSMPFFSLPADPSPCLRSHTSGVIKGTVGDCPDLQNSKITPMCATGAVDAISEWPALLGINPLSCPVLQRLPPLWVRAAVVSMSSHGFAASPSPQASESAPPSVFESVVHRSMLKLNWFPRSLRREPSILTTQAVYSGSGSTGFPRSPACLAGGQAHSRADGIWPRSQTG